MVISKKLVKSSSNTKKFKKVPAKMKVPLILDCDENLVPLVMNVVGLMSQQSAKPKKKQYFLQKYHRPKLLKRLRRKLLEVNEEKKEAEKPQQRRKSMLSDNFVRLAAALVQETPVQFPAPHASLSSTLTPSSPDASRPVPEADKASQEFFVPLEDFDTNAYNFISNTQIWALVPLIVKASPEPSLNPSLSPKTDCTQDSQLVLSQNTQNPSTTPMGTSDGNNDQPSSPSH